MVPKVSVIVAVFNAEKTLRRCFDSLISQSLKEIEVIAIDDGSTDSSPLICDEYAKRDSRFHVFHKPNEGVSATRQFGLNHATGEFVIHLDSDDYALPHAYWAFYECAKAEHADIVYSAYNRLTEKGVQTINPRIPRCNPQRLLENTIYHNEGYLWNHLYRKSIIDELHISFPDRMQFGEDQYFLIHLLSQSLQKGLTPGIAYLDEVTICYDKSANPDSLSNLGKVKKAEAKYSWWESIREIIDLKVAGKSYYSRLVADAFLFFWNRILPPDSFVSRFKPHLPDIRRYASPSARKILVMIAGNGNYSLANRLRWICSPAILRDKIMQRINRITQITMTHNG